MPIAAYFVVGLAFATVANWLFDPKWLRWFRLTPIGLAGAAMYLASTGLMNLWRFGDGLESQILYWQAGLVLAAIAYTALGAVLGARVFWTFLLALAGFLVALTAPDVQTEKGAEFLLTLTIGFLAFQVFRVVPKHDLTALLMWGFLALAEFGAALEYLDCQILHGIYSPRAEGSSCAQIYGWWAPVVFPTVNTAIWGYILWRFRKRAV